MADRIEERACGDADATNDTFRLLLAGTMDMDLVAALLRRFTAAARERGRRSVEAIVAIAAVDLAALGDGSHGKNMTIISAPTDDIDTPAGLDRVVALAGGSLDAVVCRFDRMALGWLDELSDDAWIAGLRANARTSWLLAQATVPLLALRGGSFVALTGRAVQEALPGAGAYGPGKVFEAMLLRNVAVEALASGVRVNLVRTSPATTAGGSPVGTRELPGDVAETVAFLCSPAARAISGAIVPVDAGTAAAAPTGVQYGIPARTPALPPPAPAAARLRAIVTGGAGRIGLESALALHDQAIRDGRDGLSVLLADRNVDSLSAAVTQLTAAGIEVADRICDLGDPAVPARLVEEAVARFGGLDLVHSNAALGLNDTALGADVATFERITTINLDATWRFAQAAAAHLARSGGCLIATSSIASLNANGRAPLYAASKAALTMFVVQLALEWAGKGIRANVICPGSIDTPMNQLSALPEEDRARIVAGFPTPRLGAASEVGAAVAFLAGRGASYVTGQNLVVDGGLASLLR